MRFFQIAIQLLLILSVSCETLAAQLANNRVDSMRIEKLAQQDSLQLTTSILEKKYCHNGQLRLTLQLNYANLGTRPLILYKFSVAVFQSLVSVDMEDARAERYRQEIDFMVNLLGALEPSNEAVPGDDFVVLEPHNVYTTKTHVLIFTDRVAAAPSNKLSAGEYVLQVRVHTWHENEKLAKRLSKRWRPIGFLWTDDVISLPMPFSIEPQPQVSDCSK